MTKTVRLREAKSLLRRRYIANQLVEGPHSFHPPKSAMEYGWLEPTLRLVIGKYPADRRSFAVFSDDSMNKYTNLFTPMIRIATWRRVEEAKHSGRWPLVDVRWGYLRRGRGKVDQFIRHLVRALGGLRLGEGGLYDRRKSTPSVMNSTFGDFSLMVCTEALQLELSGTALRGDLLPRLIIAGCQLLEAVRAPAPLRGWTECYDQDLSATNLVVRSHWKWIPKRGA